MEKDDLMGWSEIGVDSVAFVSGGVYTKTYGSSDQANINNLFVSYGLVEEAAIGGVTHQKRWHWLFEMFRRHR